MSRAYDAKQAALAAYPTLQAEAGFLFLTIIDMSTEDFDYEYGVGPLTYIFGDAADAEIEVQFYDI